MCLAGYVLIGGLEVMHALHVFQASLLSSNTSLMQFGYMILCTWSLFSKKEIHRPCFFVEFDHVSSLLYPRIFFAADV